MIEWKQLPRSIRYEYDGMAVDVWQSDVFVWRWTLFNKKRGGYDDNGIASSKDKACEDALRAMRR